MKTTVDIADSLLRRLRRRAADEGTTLKALLTEAIRNYLGAPRGPQRAFKLRDGSVPGRGPASGVQEGNWSQVRDMAYEGRGS